MTPGKSRTGDPPSEAQRGVSVFILTKNPLTHRLFYRKILGCAHKQRGRPLKFGRPAQILALTLPRDVLRGLRRIHPDPAWAIVSLYEKLVDKGHRPRREVRSSVALARLSDDSALIVVDPELIHSVPGVSGRTRRRRPRLSGVRRGPGSADLEVAVLDRLQTGKASPAVRKDLTALHRQIRDWRRSRRLRFSTRSIIIVERGKPRRPRRRSRTRP